MASKVDYSKVKQSFSSVMGNLHTYALERVKSVNSTFAVTNTIFKDGKASNDENPLLIISNSDGTPLKEGDEQALLDAMRAYFTTFVGEAKAKEIKDGDLFDVTKVEEPQEGSEPAPVAAESQVYISRTDRVVSEAVELIFEADSSSAPTAAAMNYSVVEQGVPKYSFPTMASSGWHSIADGIRADLMNLEIKDFKSGKSLRLSDVMTAATDKFTVPDIGIDQIESNTNKVLKLYFPESSLSKIKVYDTRSILTQLEKKEKDGRPTNAAGEPFNQVNGDMSKFGGCYYSLVIVVQKNDSTYKQYNVDTVAEICSKAFGYTTTQGVKPSDVIYVKNFISEFKWEDSKKRRDNDQVRLHKEPSEKSTTKESVEGFTPSDPRVDCIMEQLFGVLDERNHPNRKPHKPTTKPEAEPQSAEPQSAEHIPTDTTCDAYIIPSKKIVADNNHFNYIQRNDGTMYPQRSDSSYKAHEFSGSSLATGGVKPSGTASEKTSDGGKTTGGESGK